MVDHPLAALPQCLQLPLVLLETVISKIKTKFKQINKIKTLVLDLLINNTVNKLYIFLGGKKISDLIP